MANQPIYVWGFTPSELRLWPPDLQPVPAPSPPVAGPIVVNAPTALQFTQDNEAHQSLDVRPPDVILYLPPGAPLPTDILFSATVQAGQWKALRQLLACPQQFRMAEWADEVPLRQLTTPLNTLDLTTLDLPAAVRDHLQTCSVCPTALRESLRTRLHLRQQLICPSIDQLIAYAEDPQDARVARHLATCPLCTAHIAALRPVVKPMPLWFSVKQAPLTTLTTVWEGLQQAFGPVLALFTGSIAAGWQADVVGGLPYGIVRAGAANSGQLDLLAQVPAGATVDLLGEDKQITISWDDKQAAPRLQLEGSEGQPVVEFRLEVHLGEIVLWAGDSHHGQLVVPPGEIAEAQQTALDSALADPTDALEVVILAQE